MIYAQRDELLDAESVKDNVDGIRDDVIFDVVARFVPPNSIDEQWDLRGLEATLESDFGLQMSLTDLVKQHEELDAEAIASKVQERVNQHFAEKEASLGEETMRALEARDADRAGPELEGAPGAHGLPAPGHLPAWLRAEAA